MQGYHHEPNAAPRMSSRPELNTGVAQFMAGVYAWMGLGLAVTAAMVTGLSQSPATLQLLFGSPLYYVVMFGPLVMAWMLPSRIPTMNRGLAVALFLVYAALIGTAISPIPLIYSTGSIFGALAGTVGIFATMAVIGFVTKKDLSGVAQFLVMALIGAVIASLINAFFLHSGPMSYVISVIVAVVSAGLTAYYNQALKQLYMMHGAEGNLAINGALALYINFINLFLSLLRLFGSSRD
jgi:uncharacterized protein